MKYCPVCESVHEDSYAACVAGETAVTTSHFFKNNQVIEIDEDPTAFHLSAPDIDLSVFKQKYTFNVYPNEPSPPPVLYVLPYGTTPHLKPSSMPVPALIPPRKFDSVQHSTDNLD